VTVVTLLESQPRRGLNGREYELSWYLEVLKKYTVFDGRSRRSEYWYFALFNFLISIVLNLVDVGIGTYNSGARIGLLSAIYALAVLIPGIAVAIRRLHDTNRSGWWILIAFIPIVGAIILIVFMVQDSDAGENQYGANPKLAPAPS
jgi:uncharacterized membrane protein YhaH (DUF805 family)